MCIEDYNTWTSGGNGSPGCERYASDLYGYCGNAGHHLNGTYPNAVCPQCLQCLVVSGIIHINEKFFFSRSGTFIFTIISHNLFLSTFNVSA